MLNTFFLIVLKHHSFPTALLAVVKHESMCSPHVA